MQNSIIESDLNFVEIEPFDCTYTRCESRNGLVRWRGEFAERRCIVLWRVHVYIYWILNSKREL